MNPFELGKEPVWYRWIDGMVILTIGIALGMVVSYGISYFETTTTVQPIRRVPLRQDESRGTGQAEAPSDVMHFEEI